MADIGSTLLLANEKITDATPVNAGILEYIPINEVVNRIFAYIDHKKLELNHITNNPVGVRHRAADITRAEDLLG